MQRCSTSLAIRKRKLKTTSGYYFPPTWMTLIKSTDGNKGWPVGGEVRTLMNCCRSVKWCTHFGKKVWQFHERLNLELPYDLTVLLLGI